MIRVNDKFDVEWQEELTVTLMLRKLGFSFPLIIVSVDGKLVPKEEYGTRHIADGADVKVLHMMAGG